MKRKKPSSFPCFNCDRRMPISPARLFCSEVCSQEAEWVRYVRRCASDGRIEKPDVVEAIEIRLAHILNGGYPKKDREISVSIRELVIARAKGRCKICGGPGTDIDHIDRSNNKDLSNLQLLCRQCHNKKTTSAFVVLTDPQKLKKAKALRLRTEAILPKRPCDDEEKWPALFQKHLNERKMINASIGLPN